MKFLKAVTKKTSFAVFLAMAVSSPIALANDASEAEAKMEALAYAPEGSNLDERFSQFEFETDDYAEHELNDSWLGMPAYSNEGTLIGFVEDARLNEEGYATQIIVSLTNEQGTVELKGKYAELTDENVQLELSNTQIASLSNKTKLASLAE